MTQALHTLYRPTKFAEVVGQQAVIASLSKMIERRGSQAFLFCGPSGVGKTTLARIAAHKLGCASKDIMEIPAAVFTGVDNMREVQETLKYKPFGGSKYRAIILDEAHRLSKQAWDSLLKVIEEPPAHVIWLLCTTEISKVPTTIKTRCASFTLKPVVDDDLQALIKEVAEAETIKLSEGITKTIIGEANGSPRQALVNLALCRDATSEKEAKQLLRSVIGSEPTLELCRFVVKGGSWQKAMSLINKLEGENPEGVRIQICNYIAVVLKNAKTNDEAGRLLQILDAFATPYLSYENVAPLLLSIGRALFS